MAVVFISPKQRQKTVFIAITVAFVLFIVFVSVGVFSSKPSQTSSQILVFNKPKVNIDMKVFDTDQFKNLQPFADMEVQYSYTALTKDNQVQTGFISAASQDEAEQILKSMGLTVTDLKEAEIGRDNPFAPYYQQIIPVAAPRKNTTTKKTTKK